MKSESQNRTRPAQAVFPVLRLLCFRPAIGRRGALHTPLRMRLPTTIRNRNAAYVLSYLGLNTLAKAHLPFPTRAALRRLSSVSGKPLVSSRTLRHVLSRPPRTEKVNIHSRPFAWNATLWAPASPKLDRACCSSVAGASAALASACQSARLETSRSVPLCRNRFSSLCQHKELPV